VIYSVHNGLDGGFQYYEVPSTTPINDDLPTPTYPKDLHTQIGVPASMAGRPMPPGAKPVGQGAVPLGAVSTGDIGTWHGNKKVEVPSGIAGLQGFADALSNLNSSGVFLLLTLAAATIGVLVYTHGGSMAHR